MLAVWEAAPKDEYIELADLLRRIPANVRRRYPSKDIRLAVMGLLEMGLFEPSDRRHGYDRFADFYDARPACGPAVFERILAHSSPLHRRHILDVACGTGATLERLAEMKPQTLHGIDNSRGMLLRADRRLRRSPVPVELQEARAEELPFEPATLTMLVVVQALHWFDRARFWQEAARVLAKDNRIFIVTRSPDPDAPNPIGRHLRETNSVARVLWETLTPLREIPRFIGILHFERLSDPMTIESPEQCVEILHGYLHPYRSEPVDRKDLRKLLKGVRRWPIEAPCTTSVAVLQALGPELLAGGR